MSLTKYATPYPSAAPPSNFLTVVDATDFGNGPTKHYRLNDAGGTFVDRKVVGGNATAVNAVTNTLTPLVQDSVGGGGIGIKTSGYLNVPNIVENPTFTVMAMCVFDTTPVAKEVIMACPDTGIGAWSFEVQPNGAIRTYRRISPTSPATYTIWESDPGIITFDGKPVLLTLSHSASGERFRVWVNGTKYIPDPGIYPPEAWTTPPSGTNTIAAFPAGLSPMAGMIAEVMYWNSGIPDTDVGNVAAERLADAIYAAPSHDFGTVQLSTLQFKPLDVANIHPITGWTTAVDIPPTNAIVSPNGQGFDITGAASEQSESFSWHGIRGTAVSAIVNGDIETVNENVDTTPVGSENEQSRAAGAAPSGSENEQSRASGSAPSGSENEQSRGVTP